MQLFTSAEIIQNQENANKIAEEIYNNSKVQNITLRTAVQDMGTTVEGLWQDLFLNTPEKDVKTLLTSDNRLRGIGFMLLIASSSLLLIDAVL